MNWSFVIFTFLCLCICAFLEIVVKTKSVSQLSGARNSAIYVVLFLSIIGLVYCVCSILLFVFGKGPFIALKDEPVLGQDEAKELYSLLVTILLSLFATLITAYIFLIGALQGRKDYERETLLKLQTRTTKDLVSLSVITSLCLIFIFVQESKNFVIHEVSWLRYTLVFVSFLDVIALLYYTYKIINYEQEIVNVAKKSLKEIFENINGNTSDMDLCRIRDYPEARIKKQLKTIGDLEAIILQCVENHKANNRFQTKELYNGIFNKLDQSTKGENAETIQEKYKSLISLKNLIQILIDHNEKKLDLPVNELQKTLTEVFFATKYYVMNEERFERLNFVKLDFSRGCFFHTSFRGAALIDVDFTDAKLKDACFAETILRNVNFWDACCDNVDFTSALVETNKIIGVQKGSLRGAVFTNADLSGANGLFDYKKDDESYFSMENTMCKMANFLGLRLKNIDFSGSVLACAQLTNTNVTQCDFENSDMSGALLIGAKFTEKVNFCGANLSEVKAAGASFLGEQQAIIEFEMARLAKANFTSVRFQHCSFVGAYINDVGFNGVTLFHCDFEGAILTSADLTDCTIKDCNFDCANLSKTLIVTVGAAQRKKKIENTTFNNTDFSGAALRGYTFVKCEFKKAVFDDAVLRRISFVNCIFNDSIFHNSLLMDVYWKDCELHANKNFDAGIVFGTVKDEERFEVLRSYAE